MAVKTYYVLGTAAPSPNFFGQLQDGGSAPTAANSTYGWAPAKTAITTPYYAARLGASSTVATASSTSTIDSDTIPTKGTGATNTTAGDSFVTPTALTGNFANTAWTFSWNMRAGVAGAVGRIRMRVWASINADGTSARELTAGAQLGTIVTLSTTADTNSSISWSPGVVTLNNEFLFFQLEWQETTAGSSNTDTVLFRIGTSTIVTPVFSINLTFSFSSSETLTVSVVNPSLVTDNFNRADGPVGSNYTQNANNFAPLGIVSNQIYGSAGSYEMACWTANIFKNDQFAQITATSSGSFVGALVRFQSGANSGYFGVVSSGSAIIYRIDNNAFTSLNSVSYTATAGNVIRLEVAGSTLTLKINGVSVVTASDSTYASGYPGMAASNGENGDNWSAGPIILPTIYPQLASLASSELVTLTKLKLYGKSVTWSNPQTYSGSVKSILKNVAAAIHSVVIVNRATSKSTSPISSPETLTIARQKTRLLSISLVSPQIVTKYFPFIRIVSIASSQALVFSRSVPFAVVSRFSLLSMITGANFVTKNVTGKLSIVSQETLTLVKNFLRTFVLSIAETVTLAKQYIPGTVVIQKLVSVTEPSIVTLANIKTFYRTVVLSASEITTVSNIRTLYRAYTVAFPENVTTIRIASKLKLVTYTNSELVSLIKSIVRSLLVVGLETVTLARISSRFRTIVSSIGENVTQFNQKAFLRTIIASTGEIVTPANQKSFLRTLTVTSSEVFTYTKSTIKAFVITSLETVTLAKISSRFRTVLLSSGEIVTQANQKAFLKTLTVTSSELITKVVQLFKTVVYTSSEGVVFVKSAAKSFSITSLETVTLAKISSRFRTIVALIGESVTQANQKAFLRTILITSSEVVSYTLLKARVRLVSLTQSEIVTRVSLNVKTIIVSTSEIVGRQAAIAKSLVAQIHESLLLFTGNTVLSNIYHPQVISTYKANIKSILVSSLEILTLSRIASRIRILTISFGELVTQFNQKAFLKTLPLSIGQLVTRQVTRLRLVTLAYPQVFSLTKITGRLTVLFQSQFVSLTRISSKLTSFVNHELVTQFNQKAFLKTVFPLHHEVFTRISVVSRIILFSNSSVTTVNRIVSRVAVLTQSQLAFFAKVLSRTAVFTSHEVITSTFGKLYKRSLSVVSSEILVSVRSFTKQFLLSQFQLITRSSISTKLVSIAQSEIVQRSISTFKNVGFVSNETLTLLRPTRSKTISLYNSSVLSSTRLLGHIVNIIISQRFFKAAIDVRINFAQTQFVKTTGSISRKLFLFNRSSINVIAGKVRGILASIKTSQFWSYVTSKFWYLPNFLQPDGMLSFEWVTIKGWTPVASGLNLAIGIVLEVRRGECLIAYTPSLDIPPTLPYVVDNQGDIRLLVDSKIAWIRSADPNAYITVKGRIEYTVKKRIAA